MRLEREEKSHLTHFKRLLRLTGLSAPLNELFVRFKTAIMPCFARSGGAGKHLC